MNAIKRLSATDLVVVAGIAVAAAWSARLADASLSLEHALAGALIATAAVAYALVAALRARIRAAVELQQAHDDMAQRVRQLEVQLASSERRRDRAGLIDPLTQLPNLDVFQDIVQGGIDATQRRPEGGFSVAALRIERLEDVNVGLGHAAADELLLEVARRLQVCARANDTVARMRSATFLVLIADVREEAVATRQIERIEGVMRRPFRVGGEELIIQVRIGLVLHAAKLDSADEVIRATEVALSRPLGRERRLRVYKTEMQLQATRGLRTESELLHAVERGEILTYFQPIISMTDHRVVGFEALVRWRNPARGLISPLEFIPLAESNGAILPIGREVLRASCEQLAEWRRAGGAFADTTVAVNVSAVQLAHEGLVAEVQGALAQAGLPASALKLEITETVMMEDVPAAVAVVTRLRELGCQIAVDDFGTGHSSLAYLQRLPIDVLKVDRSFVTRMNKDRESAQIVRTLLGLASNLGLQVVAEGVETAQDFATLQAMGCDYAQGFWMCGPLPATEIHGFMRDWEERAAALGASRSVIPTVRARPEPIRPATRPARSTR